MMIKQILIIDRNETMSDYLSTILKPNFNIKVVNTATAAIDWLNQGNFPDLYLMDTNLPEANSLELINQLRNRVINDTPILLVSSAKNYDEVIKGLQMGANDFIAKPFHSLELIFRIEQIFKTSRSKKSIIREVNKLNTYSYC